MADRDDAPVPGREGAPDSSSQGMDEGVAPDPESGTVTEREESGVGPGAGSNPVVKVTAPVQRETDDEVTRHPSFREGERADGRS